MEYSGTTALNKILKMGKRLRIAQGGSRAGKSISILLVLINIAQRRKGKIISVVSESIPHLKRGVMRDFLDMLNSEEFYIDSRWNKTDFIYTFPNGSIIEFFSVDQPDKVRGPRRDILFINEANNISYEAYTQLAIRTSEFIYMDYNPVSEFWVNTEILSRTGGYDFDIFTYKDNELLAPEIVKEIESRKSNPNFWRVYGLGQLGESEGKIYKDWKLVDSIPKEARLVRYGLDFGYSQDPSTLIAVFYANGKFYLDEMFYRQGMTNLNIVGFLKKIPRALVIADSAEPKSISEIRSYGISILPAKKGPDSIKYGIKFVQQQPFIAVTKRSLNIIKEYRNYLWQIDNNGKVLDHPEDSFNHTMDAIRYAIAGRKKVTELKAASGGVKISGPKDEPDKVWKQDEKGQIEAPDFWTEFKKLKNKRRSSAGLER